MAGPTIGVLGLQGDVREHVAALESHGVRTSVVRRPEELAHLDGLVIPGGESTAISKLAVTFGLLEPLRERIRAGLPAYGSCAGLIMLADEITNPAAGQQTIGGLDIAVRRNAFGRQVDSFEVAIDFEGFADPFYAVFIRAPWVERVGPGVEVLARVRAGRDEPEAAGKTSSAGRIVAVRQGQLLATSFHPELTGDARVHGYFVEMVRAAA